MSSMGMALTHASFAFVAMAVNIVCQWVSLPLYTRLYSLCAAMFFGTLAGLIVKYVLDKRYIFRRQVKNRTDNFGKFAPYAVMGVITTLIFWGFELSFNSLFPWRHTRFVGAAIGLTIGYLIKYRLDKRFVFVRQATAGQGRSEDRSVPLCVDLTERYSRPVYWWSR